MNDINTKTEHGSRSEKLKFFIFSAIGAFNTLFDVVLYTIFLNQTHSILISNLLATSIALCGSYILNSRFTFKTKRWTFKTFIGFVIVTVFGLWILQTWAIYGITHFIHIVPASFWKLFGSAGRIAKQVVPKLLATAVTFLWNYIWYNKVIFRKHHDDAEEAQALGDV